MNRHFGANCKYAKYFADRQTSPFFGRPAGLPCPAHCQPPNSQSTDAVSTRPPAAIRDDPRPLHSAARPISGKQTLPASAVSRSHQRGGGSNNDDFILPARPSAAAPTAPPHPSRWLLFTRKCLFERNVNNSGNYY